MWQDLRSERYARSIAHCDTISQLRNLLRMIIVDHVSEPDSTRLYDVVIARRGALLKKWSDEVWDPRTELSAIDA